MPEAIYSKAGADAALAAALASLGTAAATDATDYATATQGDKADSASQPGHKHAATAVTVTPAGTIAATNVQAALEDLAAAIRVIFVDSLANVPAGTPADTLIVVR